MASVAGSDTRTQWKDCNTVTRGRFSDGGFSSSGGIGLGSVPMPLFFAVPFGPFASRFFGFHLLTRCG